MLLYICISVASQNKSRAGVRNREGEKFERDNNVYFSKLDRSNFIGNLEASKWIFEFEFKKKEGMEID